ncbi:hypothetical protein I3843_11G098500 [Carya illinoinensis]|uniref:protein FAR1-RELATED SEQUENCE 4-like isoform X3 n=1 Tax=Carya illinoinensis TaxID=32201 RepID=UPI001C7279DC|nr:protein FAR1-RELATED SEQUENCE 4-like isoform X3 [Carya illinoinensis]KAG7955922.1 hypothetical protein I3843_11G098500 [Carya illinoinensis]
MDKGDDGRPPRPTTSMPLIQGYYGPVNPYYPPFMMPQNTYPFPWGSQHPLMPPLGPPLPYHALNNPEELRKFQETGQHPLMPPVQPTLPYPLLIPPLGPTLPYPLSSNPEELRRSQETSQHPSMPPLGPTLPYPPSSNPEELRRFQETGKHMSMPPLGPTLPNPSSSNLEKLKKFQEASQHPLIPSGGPTVPYTLSSNPEELKRFQETKQHPLVPPLGPTLSYHSSSNSETFRKSEETTKSVSDSSTMPNSAESETNVGGTSHTTGQSYEINSEDKETTSDVRKESEGTNDVSNEDERVEIPKFGMKFTTEKELLPYYKQYVKQADKGGGETFSDSIDCRKFIDKVEHLRLGKGGGKALTDYFDRMRKMNDGFVSDMDMNDEIRVKNVFWADARSRAAYESFGDVITFDTTYLTNRYGTPFVLFLGVNHHGQSILLGTGLISSADTSTFVWLFRAWLKCMNGQAPKAIITNQDWAMKSAISTVFPDTRHRYCLWHIMQKLKEKLGSHTQFNTGLKTSIQSALYDSQTCGEFEDKWGQLLDMYNLRSNAWLQGLYNERTLWVPVYLKNVFWADMSITKRSESMHAFFEGFVHSGTTLKELVNQFDNALRNKVKVEVTADFNSINQTIPCISPFGIEKQFQMIYTNAKFKEVQEEVLGLILCNCTLVNTKGYVSTFDVLDQISIDEGHVKNVHYSVYYNEEECEFKCMCALFEMRGIFCRHAFAVCRMKKINALPEKYILDRWRKDLKRRYTLVKSSYDDLQGNADARRYEVVVKRCLKLARRVSQSDELYNAFLRLLDEFEHKLGGLTFESRPNSTNVEEKVVAEKGKKILNPHVVWGKGGTPTKRKVPVVEKVATKREKTEM